MKSEESVPEVLTRNARKLRVIESSCEEDGLDVGPSEVQDSIMHEDTKLSITR